MVIVAVAAYHTIGTGQWGYLATGMLFGLTAIALAVHAAGVRADVVGAGMAVLATMACLAVPRLTARMARLEMPSDDTERNDSTPVDNPIATPRSAIARTVGAGEPAGDGVWARVRSATLTRSALYTGLAAAAGFGASTVLVSSQRVQLPGLCFAIACAAALGLFTRRPVTAIEQAGLAVPAVILLVFSCARAQDGGQPVGLVGLAVLMTATVVFAVIGSTARAGRARTMVGYLTYTSTAALIPLALWVIGVFPRLGIR